MGLPEARIGLVPGWGGCKEMLVRLANGHGHAHGPVAPALAAFDLIAAGRVTQSAFEARRLGFLGPDDGITMNRDRLLADAKAKALGARGRPCSAGSAGVDAVRSVRRRGARQSARRRGRGRPARAA